MGPLGAAGVQIGMGLVNNASNLAFGGEIQKQQLKGQKKSLEQQNAASMDIWNKTNYGPQVEKMKEAGLNPALMYGMGSGGGGSTGSAAGGGVGGAGHPQPMMDISGLSQIVKLNAEKDLLEAQAKVQKAMAPKLEQDTRTGAEQEQNVKADTANKILEGVIKKYAGKTAQADFEDYIGASGTDADQMQREQRLQRQDTFLKENAAKQAQADNLARMWNDGTMKNMSDAELALKLKDLGVKDADIKAKNIQSALNDLELQFLNQVGSKQTPEYLKMAGKLIYFLLKGK